MSTDHEVDEVPPRHDLSRFGQALGAVAWSSFLVAGAATTVLFAFVDPADLPSAASPWWESRHAAYTIGFLFLWTMAALSAALALYLVGSKQPGPADRS